MFRKPLGLRLENIEGAAAAENYDAEESLAIDAEAAAAVGEADMVAGETEGMTASIDDSTEAADELINEVIPQLEEASAEDGMSPREAESLNQRMERICQKAGVNFATSGLVMRRESFGTTASRKSQTALRLEASKSVFTTVIDNIMKAWAWLKDQVSFIWNKFTGNAEGIKKRLNDIQTRNTQLSGASKPSKSRLKTGARFFSIDRKTDVTTIGQVVKAVEGISSVVGGMKTFLETADSGANKTGLSTADMANLGGTFQQQFVDVLKPLGERDKSKAARSVGENKEITGLFGTLPGGRSYIVENRTITAGTVEIGVSTITLDVVEDSFAEDWEAPKTKEEINKTLITPGLSVVNALISSQKNKAEVEAGIARVMAHVDNIAKEAQAFADGDKNADNDTLRNSISVRLELLKSMQGIAKTLITQGPKMLFDTASQLSDMAADAVSNMKEEKK